MDLSELKKIIAKGEDGQHQFKEDIRNTDSLAAEIVAFSNSQGGRIFIGVSNDGKMKGLSKGDVGRINQLISNAATQHVRSPTMVQTENISVSSTCVVVVVTVAEGIDKPYFDHQGVIWLKAGADKRRVHSKEELRRLFQEVDLVHAAEVPTRAGIEALNLKVISEFLQKFYHEKLPKTYAKRLQFLENMSLASGDRLNLAGLLLFGQKPQMYKPQFIIKAVCFMGRDISSRYLDSEDFEGPLSTIFQGALGFIMRNLRKVQGKKGVNTIGDLEIPETVFEELLVNALIHRDYFIDAPIRVFIFDDRIEIISPGNLPDHLTIEKIRAGNSIQRNPVLASFIAKGLLPYRGLGTGVRRALKDWSKIKLIDDREGCLFTAIVERINASISAPINASISAPINASISAPINASISALQKEILHIIHLDKVISYEKLVEKLKKDRSTIRRNLNQLKKLQMLRRLGSKKKGHWEVVQKMVEEKSTVAPISAPINASISSLQKEIIHIISLDSAILYEGLVEKLKKDRSTIRRNLNQLKKLKILCRCGSKKKGHWEISQEMIS